MPGARQRAFLTALIERIDVGPIRSTYSSGRHGSARSSMSLRHCPSASDDETQILSVPIRLRRAGRVITMRIDGADPFATTKPAARPIKLLIRAHRFNTTLVDGDSMPFAALAKREGVSPSYFTRLVRLSYLAPDITQAILEGGQPRDLTADQLFAHSRLPLVWQ